MITAPLFWVIGWLRAMIAFERIMLAAMLVRSVIEIRKI